MRRIEIAIASPSDVPHERQAVQHVFTRWNVTNNHATLVPVMWEHAGTPALGSHPQAILNKQIIERSDLLIAIFWSRLGTPTPTASSGTVEEIREFVKLKGPGRAMLYFCTRDLPHDVNAAELARLREFEAEVRGQGLYNSYKTVEEFERNLYQHLDVKVDQLLTGQLPLPPQAAIGGAKARADEWPAGRDSRLRHPIDFGNSIEAITEAFSAKMAEFISIAGSGPNKFLDLGAHTYTSAATCIDRYLSYSAGGIDAVNRSVISNLSARLKRLAAMKTDYREARFRQYWIDGASVANDLSAQVHHLIQVGQVPRPPNSTR